MRSLKTRLYSLELAQEAKDMAFWPTEGQVVLQYSWTSATLKVLRKKTAMPATRGLMLNICHHILQEAGIDDDDFLDIIFQLFVYYLYLSLQFALSIFDSIPQALIYIQSK